MRIHPATGVRLERLVPAGGTTVCGAYITENTSVDLYTWAIHCDKEVLDH